MFWIRVDSDVADSPKVGALARELGITRDGALALLVKWWGWVARHKHSGDLSGVTAEDISEGCRWRGNPDRLRSALCASGLLDRDGQVHGWIDMNGRHMTEAERKRSYRARLRQKQEPVSSDASGDTSENVRGRGAAAAGDIVRLTVPNLTQPNPTVPSDKKQPTAGGAVASHPATKGTNNNAKPADPLEAVKRILPAALVRGASMARVSPFTVAKIAAADGHAPATLLAWCYVASRDRLAGEAGKREKIESPDAWYTALVNSGKSPPDADYAEAKRTLQLESDSAELPDRARKLLADIVAKMGGGHA